MVEWTPEQIVLRQSWAIRKIIASDDNVGGSKMALQFRREAEVSI